MDYLVTFFTHFDAMAYQHYLKQYQINGILMPVPRKVSSSCGTCLVFSSDETTLSTAVLIQQQDYAELFQVIEEKYILLHKNE